VVLMHVEPLDVTFGATVTEIDLGALDQATWEELHATWLEYALLILPGQFLDRDSQNAFARRFGKLEFEAAPLSNLDRGSRGGGNPANWRSGRESFQVLPQIPPRWTNETIPAQFGSQRSR
jgi:alpha-ketoglutarate-dependent taurine dioxygenase